jgi:transcriptional regulator with XRE-family HTH domain
VQYTVNPFIAVVLLYDARMTPQDAIKFGKALRQAIIDSKMSQVELAEAMFIDASQISRWVTGKALPQRKNVSEMEIILKADLATHFKASEPPYELYVSAPITGLGANAVATHNKAVTDVVNAAGKHVNKLFWPGKNIFDLSELAASDIATERNLEVLSGCPAFLYVQFAEMVHPSSSLIELGIALGLRLKTTIILQNDINKPYMLEGFGSVAEKLKFLPQARIYTVQSPKQACELISKNGRELLGLL